MEREWWKTIEPNVGSSDWVARFDLTGLQMSHVRDAFDFLASIARLQAPLHPDDIERCKEILRRGGEPWLDSPDSPGVWERVAGNGAELPPATVFKSPSGMLCIEVPIRNISAAGATISRMTVHPISTATNGVKYRKKED